MQPGLRCASVRPTGENFGVRDESPAVTVDQLGGAAEWPDLLTRRAAGGVGELVGRDVDLSVLRGALRRAHNGRAQVVVIEGEPGMGKSTLLAAFVRGERDTGSGASTIGRTLWLRCDEFEQDITFGARLGAEPRPAVRDLHHVERWLC